MKNGWKIAILFLAANLSLAVQPLTAQKSSPWTATWGTAMVEAGSNGSPDLSGETLRMIVHSSIGGKRVRVWISNRFGTTPLHIDAAHIALAAQANSDPTDDIAAMSAINSATDAALTFSNSASLTVPPGATVVSDPVALNTPPLSNLIVSLYFSGSTLGSTMHGGANQLSFAAPGNLTKAETMPASSWSRGSWYFLTGVDVDAPGTSAVVILGDSITDGNHSTQNANHRFPDYLAARLASDPATRKTGVLGVVNAGISGNRVLLDGDGPNALARFDWDVLQRSGVRYMVLFHGINDIEAYTRFRQPYADLVPRLEQALMQLTMQAHDHGIKVFGATQMTDCHAPKCTWPDGEVVRNALNTWIRTTTVFDGMIDFDAIMRDPKQPMLMLEKYNSGDYVHPNDVGYKAMADGIDVSLFTR